MNDLNDFDPFPHLQDKAVIAIIRTRPKRRPAGQAGRMAARKIEYIPNARFDRELEGLVLDQEAPHLEPCRRVDDFERLSATTFYNTPLLTQADEQHYFHRMNLLKHAAKVWTAKLDLRHPSSRRLQKIELALTEADRIKNHLVQSNLRLVTAIAKRFLEPSTSLADLISDGCVSLLRAVEKFDFSRGYKFSTYATYAIRRNFFRSVIKNRKDRTRFATGNNQALAAIAPLPQPAQLSERQFADLHGAIARMLVRLSEREQQVVSLRFGLGQSQSQTLQQVAAGLGVCKERVRQIQSRAMSKLLKFAGDERSALDGLIEQLG